MSEGTGIKGAAKAVVDYYRSMFNSFDADQCAHPAAAAPAFHTHRGGPASAPLAAGTQGGEPEPVGELRLAPRAVQRARPERPLRGAEHREVPEAVGICAVHPHGHCAPKR